MKKFIIFCFFITLSVGAFAQKMLPEIKTGTILVATGYVNGQEFPLQLTINSLKAPVSIGWFVESYGEGSFEMSEKALDSGVKMTRVTQPAKGITKVPDDETFGIISKTAYKTLVDSKAFTYGGLNFKVKTGTENPMKINNKEVDVSHVVSEDGKTELWILNNANFPLILQSIGLSTDMVVTEIK